MLHDVSYFTNNPGMLAVVDVRHAIPLSRLEMSDSKCPHCKASLKLWTLNVATQSFICSDTGLVRLRNNLTISDLTTETWEKLGWWVCEPVTSDYHQQWSDCNCDSDLTRAVRSMECSWWTPGPTGTLVTSAATTSAINVFKGRTSLLTFNIASAKIWNKL